MNAAAAQEHVKCINTKSLLKRLGLASRCNVMYVHRQSLDIKCLFLRTKTHTKHAGNSS